MIAQNVYGQVHSRGEQYHGIPPQSPSVWTVNDNQQAAYQRPLQQTIQQSYASTQYINTQSKPQVNRVTSQYNQASIYSKPNSQGQQQFASRFQNDDPTVNQQTQNDELTTRRSKKPGPAPDLAPPTAIPSRFGDINSRKITWDPEVAKTTEVFSLRLFAILEALQGENIMISPYSIHTLLVMIAEGAGGNTYRQLNTTLGLQSPLRTRDYHQYINVALKLVKELLYTIYKKN